MQVLKPDLTIHRLVTPQIQDSWGCCLEDNLITKIPRQTNIPNTHCYRFSRAELEDFESDCYKSAPLPKLVRPADTTDAYCYKFASSDVGFKTELPESATSPNQFPPVRES
ncbi:MAG: hypothetical protein F6J93_30500 [Oscillatoria sp. SIO1A7]|nr:hypothetical protein [Oscillatoria sp. SIO1A7]